MGPSGYLDRHKTPDMILRYAPLLATTVIAVATAQAQISIGANEMPHAGDALRRTRAVINPFLDHATTGAAHTWDFSDLQVNTEDTADYQDVASTNIVYALVYADIFFNPNRANVATAGTDIPFSGLLPITDPYTFLYRSSSEYKKVGFGAEVSGIPVPIIFNEHDVIYELPLNYGDNTSSHSAWELSVPSLAHYGYEQDRTNDVDGWGTITTPSGTYDALRVKTTIAGHDTVNIDTLSLGFTIDRPIVREYKWLAQGLRVPVLQVNTAEVLGFEVITGIWFHDVPRTIEVVAPLSASLCPGTTFDVHYVATGTFNPGSFLIPANEFTAQLSDATGDFSAPTDLGSVTSTASGSITVTLPPGTPFGSGYRIRVISTSPDFVGTDNGFDLTVGGAPIASAMASGATEFCAGGSVVLEAVPGSGLDHQWQLNGTDIPGANTNALEVFAGGDYALIVSNACGADTSAPITVVVNALPEHTLDPLSATLGCDGTPIGLTAQDLSGQSGLTYQWTLDGTPITGADASAYEATVAGSYALEVTNPLTGCVFLTAAAAIGQDSVPVPSLTASGSTTFCAGDSVVLGVDTLAGASYQWTLDGSALGGATGASLTANSTGMYGVVVTGANGCTAEAAVDVVVNVPVQPVITASADTLYASGTGDLQWYLDGNAIAGANAPFLVTYFSGAYTVSLVDTNGCTSLSDPYLYISTGVEDVAHPAMHAVPNPCSGQTVLFATVADRCTVHDAVGRVVLQLRVSSGANHLDLGDAPAGMYLVRMAGGGPVLRLVVD